MTKTTNTTTAIATRPVFEFDNKAMQTCHNAIVKASDGIEKNYMAIAYNLGKVKNEELFKDDFENFKAYAVDTLGLKSSQAYNLARIGIAWIKKGDGKKTETVLFESLQKLGYVDDFSTTQLIALFGLGKKDDDAIANAKTLIENGTINPFMTVSKLKDIVKQVNDEMNPSEETTSEETTSEETENIDPVEYEVATILNSLANLKALGKNVDEIETMVKKLLEA